MQPRGSADAVVGEATQEGGKEDGVMVEDAEKIEMTIPQFDAFVEGVAEGKSFELFDGTPLLMSNPSEYARADPVEHRGQPQARDGQAGLPDLSGRHHGAGFGQLHRARQAQARRRRPASDRGKLCLTHRQVPFRSVALPLSR
jgi:hypothetical protein